MLHGGGCQRGSSRNAGVDPTADDQEVPGMRQRIGPASDHGRQAARRQAHDTGG